MSPVGRPVGFSPLYPRGILTKKRQVKITLSCTEWEYILSHGGYSRGLRYCVQVAMAKESNQSKKGVAHNELSNGSQT